VTGSKHTLVINFKTGSSTRLDSLSGQIMSLIEKGCPPEQIALELKQSPHSIKERLRVLQRRKVVEPSPMPRRNMNDAEPKLNLLWLEVTGRCNLNCIHCYASAQRARLPDVDLKFNVIARTIRESAELGCPTLQFTGGEPTLRRDLKKLILEAKDSGIPNIEVFSNGVHIPETLLNFFSKEEIHLAISIYSHRARIHDSITRVQGSHHRTMRNLKKIVAKSIPIRCEIIKMETNNNDFWGTSAMLSSLGIELKYSHPLLPIGRGIGKKSSLNWTAYSQIIGDLTSCPDICEFNRKRRWNDCWFGKASMLFNGDITPCIFARDQIAGNITRERLSFIINERIQEYWSLNKDKVDICRDCEYRYNCSDCPPLTYSLTGSLTSKPPYCNYDPHSGTMKIN